MPQFVWQRGRVGEEKTSGAMLSLLHSGYVFSGTAALVDGAVLWWTGATGGLLLPLLHLLWISSVISVVLLNPSFLEDLNGKRLPRLGAANLLTFARIHFLPLLVFLAATRQFAWVLPVYALLGLTDVLDGWIARRRGEESKLGFVLDPLSDLCFHLGIFLGLAYTREVPLVLAGLVVARYSILLLGCAGLYLWKGEIWIRPTRFGKASGFLIAVLTSLLLLSLATHLGGTVFQALTVWALVVLFALGVVHVFVIGWINFQRPTEGGNVIYRRPLGLLLGRRSRTGTDPVGPGSSRSGPPESHP